MCVYMYVYAPGIRSINFESQTKTKEIVNRQSYLQLHIGLSVSETFKNVT